MRSLIIVSILLLGSSLVLADQATKKQETEKRNPAAAKLTPISGEVAVGVDDNITYARVIQIVDKTNNIVCYGLNRADGAAISCVHTK